MGVVTAVLVCICCPLGVVVVVVCLCCLTKRRGTGTKASSSPPERGSQIPMDSADDPAPAYTYNPAIIAAVGCTSQPPPVTFLPSSYPAPSVGDPVLQHTSQQTAADSEKQPPVLPYPAASGALDPPPPYDSVLASTTPHPAVQGTPPTTHYHFCASAS